MTMRSFSLGVLSGAVAGAAVAAVMMPKKRRPQRHAARVIKTIGEIVDNVGDFIR